MPVTNVTHDVDTRTLTITAEFAAPKARDRQTYGDPRQLEKVWGPPEYPATVVEHGLKPGGRVTYYMTGPGGEKYRDTGRSSRSTSRTASRSKMALPTRTSIPLTRCRFRQSRTPLPNPVGALRPRSYSPSRQPRACRRFSILASSKVRPVRSTRSTRCLPAVSWYVPRRRARRTLPSADAPHRPVPPPRR